MYKGPTGLFVLFWSFGRIKKIILHVIQKCFHECQERKMKNVQ